MRIPRNPVINRLTEYANGNFHVVDDAITKLQATEGNVKVDVVEVAKEIDRMLSREVKDDSAILEQLRIELVA